MDVEKDVFADRSLGNTVVVVRAGEEWFSMDIDVVCPLIKDVSHARAMYVIPISCRR